ncbi:AMP-binding protein [Saccharothrix australiensis]|uniref:Acyl-CoA synthetase (AMP-forming)/AMP-acid ligase II n=1 Tax=Saccharothrix australiensis TaxID=2072 RepID=A0A495W1W2_9PSEU|nr:class I adenylate-forming enzyme family protein [Saccharothrix australiensis]RKT54705.1 acyl-CoA synthetase (AMP-forming)/AMP-acid ligase II [Saccharothrix australiensis]
MSDPAGGTPRGTGGFPARAPEELLAAGFDALADRPWSARWDEVADVERLVLGSLPDTVVLHTSGTTGERRAWPRTREQLWAEAGLLADLLRPYRPEAAVSFAPPRHLYGALVSVLVPARLGVRAWYRPGFFGALPPVAGLRVAVMAVPWTFRLLLEHPAWVDSAADLTVLHSTAVLPASAEEFRVATGGARIVEVFGSTETGGIAHRRWRGGNPLWELFPDVTAVAGGDGEVPLEVRSPRLAGGARSLRTDDFVELVDDRRFRFGGRRGRLVKVNGRRLNLDELEVALQGAVRCADLALVPVADPLVGEHVDLHLVPVPGEDPDLAAAFDLIGLRPRRVLRVGRIDRTETGKMRRVGS